MRLIAIGLILAFLAACGTKGPLVLPPPLAGAKADNSKAAAKPAAPAGPSSQTGTATQAAPSPNTQATPK